MTFTQVWGGLLIFLVCPILGGLPLISWITYAITGRQLAKLGTGNLSVATAFDRGGKCVGILAILSEALKGILAVQIASYFFPDRSVWQIVALIALVIGRYWIGKGIGTINVLWGIAVYDPIAALIISIIGGVGFIIGSDRSSSSNIAILFSIVAVVAIRQGDRSETILAAIVLSSLLAWIHGQVSHDLESKVKQRNKESIARFSFLGRKKKIISLEAQLDSSIVGSKAARLSQLKRWGYYVPDGWVVLGCKDNIDRLISFFHPCPTQPLVVRSSAIGEDSESASAAGQYLTILNITTSKDLKKAIAECQKAYTDATSSQDRQDRQSKNTTTAIVVQNQIRGLFSGVAFSRDPIDRLDDAVAIEALPGDATKVVSGQFIPQEYRVYLSSGTVEDRERVIIEGDGNIPEEIIKEVALLAREIENLYYGIPQDIEWTHDGKQLWLLQTRPITNLQPIWMRKIADRIIPGSIAPLNWSISRPLICGVCRDISTPILGEKQVSDLDFTSSAALHYSRAYFNVSLLGQIFERLGFPSESLEFLTKGAKFNRPNLKIILKNFSGLLGLLRLELNLNRDFQTDLKFHFNPTINQLNSRSPQELSSQELLERIDLILSVLKKATYYSILVPLSLAGRQAVLKVQNTQLDNSRSPQVESLESLALLADGVRNLLPKEYLSPESSCASLFADLADLPDGQSILEQFDRWLESYGYLSEKITDLSFPRWNEDPSKVRALFAQFVLDEDRSKIETTLEMRSLKSTKKWQVKKVQKRLNLKGKVSQVNSQLLAHLRWSFLALENILLTAEVLAESEDIFFMKRSEIRRLVENTDLKLQRKLPHLIRQRRIQLEEHARLNTIPNIIYGNPNNTIESRELSTSLKPTKQLQGIGASPGQVTGRVKIIKNIQSIRNIDRDTILVISYTDSRWSFLLSRAGGIIAEVGGRLSHGAIVAREYHIPAVTAVTDATQLLRDNQRVKIDGETGLVEILDLI